jgi:hypothetical protein
VTDRNSFPLKHGAARAAGKTRTYKVWASMMARCYTKSATGFENYGGRGISVCERWHDFAAFLADMGEVPEGMSLDREKSDGNYELSNCRWATRQTQNENRRSVVWLEVDGVKLTAVGWGRRLGVSAATVRYRLKHWTLRQALGFDPAPESVREAALARWQRAREGKK